MTRSAMVVTLLLIGGVAAFAALGSVWKYRRATEAFPTEISLILEDVKRCRNRGDVDSCRKLIDLATESVNNKKK